MYLHNDNSNVNSQLTTRYHLGHKLREPHIMNNQIHDKVRVTSHRP